MDLGPAHAIPIRWRQGSQTGCPSVLETWKGPTWTAFPIVEHLHEVRRAASEVSIRWGAKRNLVGSDPELVKPTLPWEPQWRCSPKDRDGFRRFRWPMWGTIRSGTRVAVKLRSVGLAAKGNPLLLRHPTPPEGS